MQERALWTALVALEEGATLSLGLAESTGHKAYAKEAEDKTKHAQALKTLIASIDYVLEQIAGMSAQ